VPTGRRRREILISPFVSFLSLVHRVLNGRPRTGSDQLDLVKV